MTKSRSSEDIADAPGSTSVHPGNSHHRTSKAAADTLGEDDIAILHLPPRVANLLEEAGVFTVRDLFSRSRDDLSVLFANDLKAQQALQEALYVYQQSPNALRAIEVINGRMRALSGWGSSCIPFAVLANSSAGPDLFILPTIRWDDLQSIVSGILDSKRRHNAVLVGGWRLDVYEQATLEPLDKVKNAFAQVLDGTQRVICTSSLVVARLDCNDEFDSLLSAAWSYQNLTAFADNKLHEINPEGLADYRLMALQAIRTSMEGRVQDYLPRPFGQIVKLFQAPARFALTAKMWQDWWVGQIRSQETQEQPSDRQVEEASRLLMSADLGSELKQASLMLTNEVKRLRKLARLGEVASNSAGTLDELKKKQEEELHIAMVMQVFGSKQPSISGMNAYLKKLHQTSPRLDLDVEQKKEVAKTINHFKSSKYLGFKLYHQDREVNLTAKFNEGKGTYWLREPRTGASIESPADFPLLVARKS